MRTVILLFAVIVSFSSCSINNSILLKADRDYVFDTIPENTQKDYQISRNDELQFSLFSNDGFRIVDMSNGQGQTTQRLINSQNTFTYTVEVDGRVNLPIIGRIALEGMTLKQAEEILEDRYKSFYINPFVILNVSNRRVVVFTGNAGGARIVQLTNDNMTLIEVLAAAGGIADRGKAKSVRLIRYVEGKRKIFNIDLSTIEGIKHIDLIIEAGDVVYIEPQPEIAREVLADITPVITLLTTTLSLYIILTRGL